MQQIQKSPTPEDLSNKERLNNLGVTERLAQVNLIHKQESQQVYKVAREQLPVTITDTISPKKMIAEGFGKIVGNVGIDMLDLGISSGPVEWAMDAAIGRGTEYVTNRKLRNNVHKVSAVPSGIDTFNKFAEKHLEKELFTPPKTISGFKSFGRKLKHTLIEKPKNLETKLAKKGHKFIRPKWAKNEKLAKLGWMGGDMIPFLSAISSPGAFDGVADLYYGFIGIAKGEKSIKITRIRPTTTSTMSPVPA